MSYLTEQRLAEIFDYEGIQYARDKKFQNFRFRPDFRIDDLQLVVEFDGFTHYTSSKRIIADYEKDQAIQQQGYQVIRIPYFIQLCPEIFKDFDILQSFQLEYPHGFIDEKATLPSDFCSLGVQRFNSDLERYNFAKDAVLESLAFKASLLKDYRLVYPQGFAPQL